MIIQDHGLHTAAFRDRIFTNPPKWINEWRIRYKKPVVLDEIAYEGNIQAWLGKHQRKRNDQTFLGSIAEEHTRDTARLI